MAKINDFQTELDKYLRKCELEYRAANLPNGCCVDWLAPFCGSTKEIAEYLRYLGFKVKEIVDEAPFVRWVETTNGVIVCVNNEHNHGFMFRSCSYWRKKYVE